MDAGLYRNKILIEKLTVVDDKIGNKESKWTPFMKLYAYANGISGNEYWVAKQVKSENTIDFTVRCQKCFLDIVDTKKYRIIFKGKIFNIKKIDNIRFENKDIIFRCISEDGYET